MIENQLRGLYFFCLVDAAPKILYIQLSIDKKNIISKYEIEDREMIKSTDLFILANLESILFNITFCIYTSCV